MALKYASSNKQDYRLAVVVSKKVSKSAVTRNRIRRRIYERVRLAHKQASTKWPYDMVITVFDDRLATLPSEVLTTNINRLLEKAEIL